LDSNNPWHSPSSRTDFMLAQAVYNITRFSFPSLSPIQVYRDGTPSVPNSQLM